jgi:predicted HD phosphohydrolase
MHATHTDPRRILVAATAALVLALVAAALLSALGDLSFSTGGDPAPAGTEQSAYSAQTAAPSWVTNPIASPLVELQTPTRTTP